MLSIYKNSALNIAASSPIRCDSGFLGPRAVRDCRSTEAHWLVAPAGPSFPAVLAAELGDLFNCSHEPASTLNERAWVLQEQQLSARAPHFSSEKMY